MTAKGQVGKTTFRNLDHVQAHSTIFARVESKLTNGAAGFASRWSRHHEGFQAGGVDERVARNRLRQERSRSTRADVKVGRC